jgi:hypothetical protein
MGTPSPVRIDVYRVGIDYRAIPHLLVRSLVYSELSPVLAKENSSNAKFFFWPFIRIRTEFTGVCTGYNVL